MSLNEKARAAIAEYNMLTAGDSVVAGVSGGADSVALLCFLASLRGEWEIRLTALHLNHGLRGDESDRDEAFVKELCARLEVDFVSEKADVQAFSREHGTSLEETGRKARYDFFARAAKPQNAKIATAHTLNDSLETVLLNLARGSDLRGLCGIPAARGNIIRPLIACGRDEIEAYLKERGIGYITDSSNSSDDFSRNRIRRHVLPVLLSVNQGLYKTAALNLKAREIDADYLDFLGQKALLDITLENGSYSREKYLSLAKALRPRVLMGILSRASIYYDTARLSRLDGIVGSGSGAEQLSATLYFIADELSFCVRTREPEAVPGGFCMPANIPKDKSFKIIEVFSDKKLEVCRCEYEHYEKNCKYDPSLLKNCLDCDKIDGNLILRARIASDKIRLAGRRCTKTLKKLFSEAKIPQAIRGRIFVLADDGGAVWVEGFGAAERVAPSETTKHVMIFKIKGDEIK